MIFYDSYEYFFDEGTLCIINILIWFLEKELLEENFINNVQKISDAEEPCPICLETFYEK